MRSLWTDYSQNVYYFQEISISFVFSLFRKPPWENPLVYRVNTEPVCASYAHINYGTLERGLTEVTKIPLPIVPSFDWFVQLFFFLAFQKRNTIVI